MKNCTFQILQNDKLKLLQHIKYYLPCFSPIVLKLGIGAACSYCSILNCANFFFTKKLAVPAAKRNLF